jgi:hypothetical protein
MAALRALADEKASAFRRRFEGRMLSAVTLEGGTAEQTPALSANFLKVEIAGAIPANRMVEASIFVGSGAAVLTGRFTNESPSAAFASKS